MLIPKGTSTLIRRWEYETFPWKCYIKFCNPFTFFTYFTLDYSLNNLRKTQVGGLAEVFPLLKLLQLSTAWTWHWRSLSWPLTLVAKECAAPASSRTEATSTCPSRAEMCRGVYPFVVAASGWAICCRSSWTISVLPSREAICKGVCSSYNSRQEIS